MKVLLLFLLFITRQVFADNTVFINEFLIEPTPQQVEIMNTGTQSTDISGWYIDDSGGTTYYTIPESSILYPNACMAFSGDFNLNKSSADTIRLLKDTEVIDSFSYKLSSGSGISYVRLPDGSDNWTTKSAGIGMYNETGISCMISPTPAETPVPAPTSYNNIFISEVMANPASGENEWVELFNSNDYSVSLIGWFIDDTENAGSSPKLFSLDIPSKNYGILELSGSMLNNAGDSVRLLDFNKNSIDSFEYSNTTQGKTLGRVSFDSDEFCFQEPSKGNPNNSCINPSPTSQPVQTPTKIPTLSSTKSPITKPISINPYINTNSSNSMSEKGEILGISDQNYRNSSYRLIRPLSFLSFSYSLLTIAAVLLRMKNRYEKGV